MPNKKFAGGEYFYGPLKLLRKKTFSLESYIIERFPDRNFILTNGGNFSLSWIIKNVDSLVNGKILLPSYLCPTIIESVKKTKTAYSFYKVDRALNIDIDDLKNKLNEDITGVFIVDYFGFGYRTKEIELFEKISKRKIILIEDKVQGFFSKHPLIGDFVFNSFRKFLPADGSVILFNNKLENALPLNMFTNYLYFKTVGQFFRYLNYNTVFNFEKLSLRYLKKSEGLYNHQQISQISQFSKYIIQRYNFEHIQKERIKNYRFLVENLGHVALFNKTKKTNVPLGFPILLNNRDYVRKELMKSAFFCPIHWDFSQTPELRQFYESYEISKKILTIPINENVSISILKKMIKIINRNIHVN
jgi:dTDP-4-amino-4,6-dideoxygalactose transaminase